MTFQENSIHNCDFPKKFAILRIFFINVAKKCQKCITFLKHMLTQAPLVSSYIFTLLYIFSSNKQKNNNSFVGCYNIMAIKPPEPSFIIFSNVSFNL